MRIIVFCIAATVALLSAGVAVVSVHAPVTPYLVCIVAMIVALMADPAKDERVG